MAGVSSYRIAVDRQVAMPHCFALAKEPVSE
jgi:hypothetical protein